MKRMTMVASWVLVAGLLTACFEFDETKEDFKISGIYDGSSNTKLGGCTPTQVSNLLFFANGYDYEGEDSGSIGVHMPATCFPTVTSGFHRFDIISPKTDNWDPDENAGFEDYWYSGFGAYVRKNIEGTVYAQAMAAITTPGGAHKLIPGVQVLLSGDDWQLIDVELDSSLGDVDPDYAYIRFYVDEDAWYGYEATVYVDHVSPSYIADPSL